MWDRSFNNRSCSCTYRKRKRKWYQGGVTSLEESPEYFDAAARLLPEHCKPYVDLVLAPTMVDSHEFLRGVRYRDIPERPYDFVFVDGPIYKVKEREEESTLFDFDFIHIVKKSKAPVYGIVDTRTSTCYALHAIFGPEKFRYDYVRKLGFIGPCTKGDVGNARKIVARTMASHTFRRYTLRELFF